VVWDIGTGGEVVWTGEGGEFNVALEVRNGVELLLTEEVVDLAEVLLVGT